MTPQTWLLQIDWDGDGEFSAENEAGRMVFCDVSRGRRFLVNSAGDGFEPVEVGLLTVHLDNDSGRYDPYNTGSPLYPYVRPGVKIKLLTTTPGGTQYPVFAGQVSDIQPISSGTPKKVLLTAVDGVRWLRDQEAMVNTQQTIGLDDAIGRILDAAAWPWARALDATADVIRWFWEPPNANALAAINKIADGGLGVFFVAADGSAKFYDRNRLAEPAATIDQSQILKEISIRQPWEVVRNRVQVISRPRQEQAWVDVWRLFEKPLLIAGESFVVWAEYSAGGENVPISMYQNPAQGIDLTVNTAADGSGTDISSSCAAVTAAFSSAAKITVTNNSGQNGYIILLKLRATPLTSAPSKMIFEDTGSQTLYGPKSLTIDSIHLQDGNLAASMGAAILSMLATPQIFPTVGIERQPELQFSLDLFDVVDLVLPALGIAESYRVGHIRHQWIDQAGQATKSTLTFEPVNALAIDAWRFPVELGLTSKFAF